MGTRPASVVAPRVDRAEPTAEPTAAVAAAAAAVDRHHHHNHDADADASSSTLSPKEQCNVTDVLGVLLAGLEGLARNQQVDVTWEVVGSQGRRLPDAAVNPYELRKVLATVLDAALHQAAPGGSIHLALSATSPLSAAPPVVDVQVRAHFSLNPVLNLGQP